MEEKESQKRELKLRFSEFKADNWVIFVIECLLAIGFIYFDVGFWVDLGRGVSFLGDGNKGYEIAICIIVLLLAFVMLFIVFWDMFIRDYEKETENIEPKEFRKGHVVTLSSEKEIKDKEDKTAEEDKKE
jgi:hypothetical protein